MLYTEQSVRDNIRNRQGKRVFYLGPGDQLTPGARDYLRDRRIEILPASEAKPECYRLLSGGTVAEKPEHMTHLNGNLLVSKCHPRIGFRGAMDSLQAELLLCQTEASEPLRRDLGEILELSRHLLSCEVMDEPVKWDTLCGLTEQEQRLRSHRPQEFYGQPHFMPTAEDSREILLLNRLRCAVRQAERAAVAAFTDGDGNPIRTDILRALNRMSSMIYILMLQRKAAKTPPTSQS